MPLVRLDAEEDPTPNMAPMIDVILVLTIFFMCATKFSGDERKLDLDLPRAGQTAAVEERPTVLEVAADGSLRLGGEPVAAGEIAARLAVATSRRPDLTVLIRGERAVSHGRMTEVYEACRAAGVRQLAIAVRPAGDQGGSRTR